MNTKIAVGLIVLAAGVLTGWYFLKGSPTVNTETAVTVTPTPSVSNLGAPESATDAGENRVEKGGEQERILVTFSASGFSPKEISVKKGTTVTFINESDNPMWVASALHPTHQLLPGFDQLKSVDRGGTYEYTFVKVGTWKYHNHMVPSSTGTIVVAE